MKLLSFVLGRTTESETPPAVVVVTSPVVVRRKRGKGLDPLVVEKCTGVYKSKSVLDAAVKRPIVKGFISRKRAGRAVATLASVVRERKHMEELDEEEGEEEGHVSPPKKRGGWLY